jgi:hypothetical protein
MRAADTVRDRYCLRGGRRGLVTLVALAGLALLVAGCGGSSSIGVASLPSASATTLPGRHLPATRPGGGVVRFLGAAPSPAQRASSEVSGLLFSRCMRSHGVPDFPDPPGPSAGPGIFFQTGSGFDPAAPLFRKAQRTCVSFLTRRRTQVG